MSKLFNRLNLTALGLIVLIVSFLGILIYVRFITVEVLRASFAEKNKLIANLREEQKDQSGLLDQITIYRDALYGLNLVLEARKNVLNGSEVENPYLVFDFRQVLNDLRQLLPEDARATKFQVNNKGLITLPIESVDYASLGRVLKSFKDKSQLQASTPVRAEFFKIALFKLLSDQAISIEDYKKYSDLSEEDWSYQYAQLAGKMGLTQEVDGEHFYPEQEVNRLEALTTLLALFKVALEPEDEPFSTLPFVDMAEDNANLPLLLAAHQKGLFTHMTDEFQPNLPITRSEVAYWVWKLQFD